MTGSLHESLELIQTGRWLISRPGPDSANIRSCGCLRPATVSTWAVAGQTGGPPVVPRSGGCGLLVEQWLRSGLWMGQKLLGPSEQFRSEPGGLQCEPMPRVERIEPGQCLDPLESVCHGPY
jgi:hypothetical protein